jgi:hypothetical protein
MLSVGRTDDHPMAIASATSSAANDPLNESGAMTIFMHDLSVE